MSKLAIPKTAPVVLFTRTVKDLPLNGLRVLAAVLDTGGVRAAGRMLSLSPSVVHRHLRELEGRIGTSLAERTGGRLRFTEAGRRLGRIASDAFGTLTIAVDSTREERRPNEVVIATTESLALNWLVPRLATFTSAQGRYTISVKTDQRLLRIPREADLAIRMGSTLVEDAAAVDPLMDEIMVPVATPEAAAAVGSRIEALLAMPLLHDRDPQVSWTRWCLAMGIDAEAARAGARLSSSSLVLAAAASGLGIALARRRLAEAALAAGSLVELAEFAVPFGTGYWLVRRSRPRVAEQFVIDWLRWAALK